MVVPVKNMVCQRCIAAVETIFTHAGVKPVKIELGRVEMAKALTKNQEKTVRERLLQAGFEWLDDQQATLVAAIKKHIVELVHYSPLDEMREPLSVYLSKKLNKSYHQLSFLFSAMESTTIEQYFILQKIEKVKEWLVYNEYSIKEMAFRLGYSSVAHLSSQFKKITGFSPAQFRSSQSHHRTPLDKV